LIPVDRDECYRILGLKPGSDIQEVKAAYKSLVKKYHADKVHHIEDEELRKAAKELFEEKMRVINEVYEILCSSWDSRKSGSKKETPESEGKKQESEYIDKTCAQYFKRKESELFQKSFEQFKRNKGFDVYDREISPPPGPVGQIINLLDEEFTQKISDISFIEKEKKVEKKEEKKSVIIKPPSISWKSLGVFLLLVYILSWAVMGGIYLIGRDESNENYNILRGLLIFCPIICVIITTYITGGIKFKFPSLSWGKPVHYLYSWLIIIGFIIFSFLLTVIIHKGTPDLNFELLKGHTKGDFSAARQFLSEFILATTFYLIFSTVMSIGSEYAWRGFLLTNLMERGKKKALLLTGLFWGIWYIPIVLMGYYAQGYSIYWKIWTGESPWYTILDSYYQKNPLQGIFMKLIFCLLFSILLSWIYLETRNILLTCFSYATFEQINPLGYIVIRNVDPLTGGTEGMAGIAVLIIILTIFLLYSTKKEKELSKIRR